MSELILAYTSNHDDHVRSLQVGYGEEWQLHPLSDEGLLRQAVSAVTAEGSVAATVYLAPWRSDHEGPLHSFAARAARLGVSFRSTGGLYLGVEAATDASDDDVELGLQLAARHIIDKKASSGSDLSSVSKVHALVEPGSVAARSLAGIVMGEHAFAATGRSGTYRGVPGLTGERHELQFDLRAYRRDTR